MLPRASHLRYNNNLSSLPSGSRLADPPAARRIFPSHRTRTMLSPAAVSKDLSMGVPQCRDDAGSGVMLNLQKALLTASAELVDTELVKVRSSRPDMSTGAEILDSADLSRLIYPDDLTPRHSVQEEDDAPQVFSARDPLTNGTKVEADKAMSGKVSKSGRPLRTPRHLPADDASAAMKRTRSAKSDAAGKPTSSKKKKGRGVGDIKSPTSRTLLRMLRVGTGQATANNTSKAEAEKHIRRLAGEFTPTIALAKRYAGREALQELLSKYLGKPISFQEAVACFENPHNRGLQATQALSDLLQGRSWPPYPENAGEPLNGSEDHSEADNGKSEAMDAASPSRELAEAAPTASSPAAELPTPTAPKPSDASLGQVITSGSWTDTDCSGAPAVLPFSLPPALPNVVDEFRPVITTGFSKAGTAFQTELDLAAYNRRSGAHNATLELRSLQLLSHNIDPPAALVTIRRHRTDDPPLPPSHQDKPISLSSLRLSTILAIKPPSFCLPAGSGLAPAGL